MTMNQVIAVASEKGGQGKTALVRLLAVHYAMKGRKVAVIDADVQGSMVQWDLRRQRSEYSLVIPVAELGGRPVKTAIADARKKFGADMIIIDTPPHTGTLLTMIAAEVDAAVIPITPLPDDLVTLRRTIDKLKRLFDAGRAAVVLNRVQSRSSDAEKATGGIIRQSVPLCPQYLSDLKAHRDAMLDGSTVLEADWGKATEQAQQVMFWLDTHIIGKGA